MRGSRCLCVSLSILLMPEASLRDVDAAFGGARLHWLDQPPPHLPTMESTLKTRDGGGQRERDGWIGLECYESGE